MKVSDLPAELLNPVQADSGAELTRQFKLRGSLTLNGSALTLGALGEGRTLRLANGARIVTHGNNLVIEALDTRFADNAGISAFSPQTIKAAATSNGAGGGKVQIYALEGFSG